VHNGYSLSVSLDRRQLRRYHLKTDTESSLRNVAFWVKCREMNNIQICEYYTTYFVFSLLFVDLCCSLCSYICFHLPYNWLLFWYVITQIFRDPCTRHYTQNDVSRPTHLTFQRSNWRVVSLFQYASTVVTYMIVLMQFEQSDHPSDMRSSNDTLRFTWEWMWTPVTAVSVPDLLSKLVLVL
jgi:hypothetical protein